MQKLTQSFGDLMNSLKKFCVLPLIPKWYFFFIRMQWSNAFYRSKKNGTCI